VSGRVSRIASDGAAGGNRGRPARVRGTLRAVLVVLLAAPLARAEARIEDAELAEAMRQLDYDLREQATLDRPLYDVVTRWRGKLQRARTSRESAIGHFLLAAALERAGSRDAAVGQLQLAIDEFGAFPLAHMTLGRLYLDEGNFDRARDCFTRCREIDPDRDEATVALAVTHLREGSADGAERARALLEPLYARRGVPDVASWLAMAHLRRAQAASDPSEGRAALERAWTLAVEGLREAPGRDNARAAFAAVLRALDDDPAREPRFAAAVRSLPPGPPVFETVAAVVAVFRATGRAPRAGFWLHVALTTQAALREPRAMRAALGAAAGDDGAQGALAAASATCRERLGDAARPLALRRGEARLLRVFYLPALATFLGGEGPAHDELALAYALVFRLLLDDDPTLRAEALRLAIDQPHPRMVLLLSMTLESELTAGQGGANAVLAVRALGTAGGAMAIPGLLRSLSCADRAVRAEAHAQLLRITGTLDPALPQPLPDDAQAHWRAYFRDARGADCLREGLEQCVERLRPTPDGFAWTPRGRALTWHVLTQVLEDDRLPPELWERAWAVIVGRSGDDPRAEAKRGTPIDDAERRELAAALRARFGTASGD